MTEPTPKRPRGRPPKDACDVMGRVVSFRTNNAGVERLQLIGFNDGYSAGSVAEILVWAALSSKVPGAAQGQFQRALAILGLPSTVTLTSDDDAARALL